MFNSPAQANFQQWVKTQTVEILIQTANSTLPQFPFPTQDFLREKFIVGIETFNANDIPLSPNSGAALITNTNMSNAFLTLYEQNPEQTDAQGIQSSGQGQWNESMPLYSLHRMQNTAGDPFVRELTYFTPRIVTWEKSFVKLAPGTLLENSGPVCFLFQVSYIGNAGDNF